jgi:hypothetical protein
MIKYTRLLFILALISLGACTLPQYSFTGGSTDAKTINIDFFPNKAAIIQPTLSQTFTETLRDKFINQSKLELVSRDGELQLEGEIVDYQVRPVAIQGDETAALNRLTIKVNVRFTNTLDETQSFDQAFSNYEDFSASTSLSSIEEQLIEEINQRLVEDIFNKALVNW